MTESVKLLTNMTLQVLLKFEKDHLQLPKFSRDQNAPTLPPTDLTKNNTPPVAHRSGLRGGK